MANAGSTDICPGPSPRKERCCKVLACAVDLRALGKPYCFKKGLCPEHMRADALRLKGGGDQVWRFCQQCGKLEALSCFDPKARSCKKALAKRRQHLANKHDYWQPPLRQHWQQQQQGSTHSSQPAAESSAFAVTNHSGSTLGWSMDHAALEHGRIARTSSSNTACSCFGPLATAASAAGGPAMAQQQAPGNSNQQQQVLLQVAGSAAGSATLIPVMMQQQQLQCLLLRQQLAGSAAAAAAQPGWLVVQQQHQQLLQQLAGGAAATPLANYNHQQLQLLANSAATPAAQPLLIQQQQQQQQTQLGSAAGTPMAAAGATPLTATATSNGLNPSGVPAGYLHPPPPHFSQLAQVGMQQIPARMSSTGSSGFVGLSRQDSARAATAAAVRTAEYAGLSGQHCNTAAAGSAGLLALCRQGSAAAAAAAAAEPAGSPGLAGASDLGCSAGAGFAGPAGFGDPALTLSEAELDALINEELLTPGMQLGSSATVSAAAAAAGEVATSGPLTAPSFGSSDVVNFREGSFDQGFAGGAGTAEFALLDESELDAILEQEMLAARLLVPAGGRTSGCMLTSTPSGSADTQHAQTVPPSASAAALPAQGAAMAAQLPAPAAAAAPTAPPAQAGTAAPAVPPPVALPAVAAPPPTVAALPMPSALAAAAAPSVTAAGGGVVMPAAAAKLLHAAQSGRLDALISGLVGLTATLQQLQQAQQQAQAQQQMQQQPQGMLHGQVESGMQSYGSVADTWFYNSL